MTRSANDQPDSLSFSFRTLHNSYAAASAAIHCLTINLCSQMNGTFKVDGSGKVEFQEEDGIDYAPVTVQLSGGERVPFLFTIKELSAKGTLEGFGGDFTVPSYRGSSFLDPKVGAFTSVNIASQAVSFASPL